MQTSSVAKLNAPGASALVALLAASLLAGCATTPVERFPAPPPEQPAAEVLLGLMPASRNRSAGLYVRGAVKCSPPGAASLLNRTIEEEPRLVGGSWENRHREVVRLPAGAPLPLRFRYQGPGEDWIFDFVVQLQPGARYVFDHEIPGRSYTLKDSATGLPAPMLPPKLLHGAVSCPG
jgi:hypothetical protein